MCMDDVCVCMYTCIFYVSASVRAYVRTSVCMRRKKRTSACIDTVCVLFDKLLVIVHRSKG